MPNRVMICKCYFWILLNESNNILYKRSPLEFIFEIIWYDTMYRLASAAAQVSTGSTLSASYGYANDLLTSITTGSASYRFTYGDFSLLSSIRIGSRTLATYTYTEQNNYLETLAYGNGYRVQYTYDNQGRVTKQRWENGDTVTYQYDNSGLLASVTDSTAGSITYYYDLLSRYAGSRTDDGWSRYTYGENGQLSRRDFYTPTTGALFERYVYDTDSTNAISDGALLYMRMDSGNYLNYRYDALQRVTDKYIERDVNVDRQIWERFHYEDGYVSMKENWIGNTYTHKFSYTYDKNGNILTVTDSENGTSVAYTYDSANQLTQAVHGDGRVESYSYDDAGNILTFNNGSRTHTYTYGDSEWGDLLTAVDGQSITYDAIGNPLSYYDGYRYTFTWEEGRQLASITYLGNTTTYEYDQDGIRTKKIRADGRYTVYDIIDGKAVGETRYTSTGAKEVYIRYIFDESGVVNGISLWYPGDTAWTDYYFAKNLQGDVLEVYDSSHTCVASYTYDSWGNILSKSGDLADINPFRYRSYYYDTETWFYYLQSRYYDPQICRFLNADGLFDDTAGFLGNNLFVYCANSPVNYTDNTGGYIETILDVASVGVSLLELICAPTLTNLGFLLWDIGALLAPFVPGSYAVKGGKLFLKVASKIDDFADGSRFLTGTYNKLKKLYKGIKNIEIHHLIEKRFAGLFSKTAGDFLSIPLTKDLHRIITNRWRNLYKLGDDFKLFKYGSDYSKITYSMMERAIKEVYGDMPGILDDVLKWFRKNWEG